MLPSHPFDTPLPPAAPRGPMLPARCRARRAEALRPAGAGGALLPGSHSAFPVLVGNVARPPQLAAVVAVGSLGVGIATYAPGSEL